PWKYGAITASGDVFLTVLFCRLFLHHERQHAGVDLLRVASEAKHLRCRQGVPRSKSVANIFFTLPGSAGFQLHSVSIRENTIDYERVEPISTRFSMREERSPDRCACQRFNSQLRPSFFFTDVDAFRHHHRHLVAAFYAAQSGFDERVTATFDLFVLEKRTGLGAFWQGSPSKPPLALVNVVG
ncbi:hypothetical protein KQ945_17650, partial [Bacillus subtilis subsp. subtilis]|nr:hypothetical protein [Bacillus subtilis subsp. subtilis]